MPAAGKVAVGRWAQVTTQGGCLKVRLSFELQSQAIDCLPYKLLVFVDAIQHVGGIDVVHLAGRGYTYPEGLAVVDNPAEAIVPFINRPHDLGTIAYTALDGNVWLIGADGAGAQRITGLGSDQNSGAFYSGLNWSPDGTTLLMRRELDAVRDLQVYSAGRPAKALYPPRGAIASNPGAFAWSADSAHVLLVDYDDAGNACERPTNQYSLRSVEISTSSQNDLYRGTGKGFVAGLAASPDGHYVAMLIGAGCDSKSFGLCILALQADPTYGVKEGQLRCPPGTTAGQIAWAPNSKLLAFTSRLQTREDESALTVGLPLEVLDPHSATYYLIAWPLRYGRNVIGAVWLPDSHTLRLQEEVPRSLADIELPDRIVRRLTVDGSAFPLTEMANDRLVAVRPVLAPGAVHGQYSLAIGARGELWVLRLGQQDERWQLTPEAVAAAAWSP